MKKYLVPVLVILVVVLGAWAILKQSSPNGSDLLGAVSSGVSPAAITVTFPNSGELLFRGTSTPILWNSVERYDVKIELIAADTGKTYILATSTPTRKTGGRFVWKKIGFDLSGNVVPDNKYYVQICQVNTGTAKAACDKSDLPVVVYTYIANKPPRIKNITGPGELKVNEEGAWSITAVDPENGPLSYNVYWGDEVGVGKSYSQTATFKHVYTNPGTYYVYFVVKDTAGQVASGAVMVNVVKVGVGKPVVSVGTARATLLIPLPPVPVDQGPMFTTSYNVKITASGGDVYIPVDYTFNNTILNGGNSVLTPPFGSSIGSTDPQIPCPNAKGNCWLIKSGQTIYLSPSFSYNTYQMFAGNYSAYLQSISQVVDGSYLDTPIPYTPTNSVVVVGERSPYLLSVTSPVAAGVTGVINGVRLSGVNIGSSTNYPLKITASSDSKVTFMVDSRETPGGYLLWLEHPTNGASNRMWFEVVKGTTTPKYRCEPLLSGGGSCVRDDINGSIISTCPASCTPPTLSCVAKAGIIQGGAFVETASSTADKSIAFKINSVSGSSGSNNLTYFWKGDGLNGNTSQRLLSPNFYATKGIKTTIFTAVDSGYNPPISADCPASILVY